MLHPKSGAAALPVSGSAPGDGLLVGRTVKAAGQTERADCQGKD